MNSYCLRWADDFRSPFGKNKKKLKDILDAVAEDDTDLELGIVKRERNDKRINSK